MKWLPNVSSNPAPATNKAKSQNQLRYNSGKECSVKFRQVLTKSIGNLLYAWKIVPRTLIVTVATSVVLNAASVLSENMFWHLILSIALVVVYAIAAVSMHRVIVLGPDAAPRKRERILTRTEVAYILYGIVLELGTSFVGLAGFALVGLPIPANVICVVVGLAASVYLFVRLSLVFPAIAVGHTYGFRAAWEITKPFQKEMLFAVILAPVSLALIFALIILILPMELLRHALGAIVLLFGIAALSTVYKYIWEETCR